MKGLLESGFRLDGAYSIDNDCLKILFVRYAEEGKKTKSFF